MPRSQNKWPDFITNWGGLQKLDLSVVSLGSAARVSLDAIARIPIVRIKSQQGMNITVPKKALWKHLWLECSLTMDITFEDVNTFGMVRPTSIFSRSHSVQAIMDTMPGHNLEIRFACCGSCDVHSLNIQALKDQVRPESAFLQRLKPVCGDFDSYSCCVAGSD